MQHVTIHRRANGLRVPSNVALGFPREISYRRQVVRNKVTYDCVRITDVSTIKSYLRRRVVRGQVVRVVRNEITITTVIILIMKIF